MGIVASVTASFSLPESSSSSENFLNAQLRKYDEQTKIYKTETNYKVGDTPIILVSRSPKVVVKQVITTQGNVVHKGQYTEEQIDGLSFETLDDSDSYNESSVNLPISGSYTTANYGGDVGSIVLLEDKRTFRAAKRGVAVFTVTYNTVFDVYRLENVPATVNGTSDFEVKIVVVGGLSG